MALSFSPVKNGLTTFLFMLLFVVLMPLLAVYGLLSLPFTSQFAKRRVRKLNEIIANDWLPRKKYIYISYDDTFALASFIQKTLIPKYGDHIIFDRWLPDDDAWTDSEPDAYNRSRAISQDIAGDYDGDPQLTMLVLTPEKITASDNSGALLRFTPSEEGFVAFDYKDMALSDAEKLITTRIESALKAWAKQV